MLRTVTFAIRVASRCINNGQTTYFLSVVGQVAPRKLLDSYLRECSYIDTTKCGLKPCPKGSNMGACSSITSMTVIVHSVTNRIPKYLVRSHRRSFLDALR